MSQTNWIAAYIVIGFITFVIARGQLNGYLSVLGLAQSSGTTQPVKQTTQQSGIEPLSALPALS